MLIIKIGGGENINIENIAEDLAQVKEEFIIVHGGNFYLDDLSKKLGFEKKMLESPTGIKSRYTSREIIELIYLTYAGLANKKIVESLQKNGINAIGLSGIDGKLIIGKKHDSLLTVENGKKFIVKDDLTGSVEKINIELINNLLKLKLVPVITPPVITDNGQVINVDGDKVAAHIAKDMKAHTLIFFIEAAGVLGDLQNEKSLIKKITEKELEDLILQVSGRMKRKLMEITKLLKFGTKKIIVADGRIKNPVTNALNGGGTHVT